MEISDSFARAFLSRYLRAWNDRRPEGLLALAAEDVRWLDPSIPGGQASGHEEVGAWLSAFWRAFPDITFDYLSGTPDCAAVSFDRSVLIAPWRCYGTWLGPLEPPGFAPNGSRIELVGTDFYRFRDGRLIEVRTITDLQDVGRQLRLLPRPGGRLERALAAAQRASSWVGAARG